MNKTRILLVDDEAAFTRLLKLNLEQTGDYTVEVANKPQAAFQAATRFLPDIILMDVMMPGTDGGSLAAMFKDSEMFRNVPIIFLTAAVKRDEVKAHQGMIGGLPFLAKPVDLAELTRCLQQQLQVPH